MARSDAHLQPPSGALSAAMARHPASSPATGTGSALRRFRALVRLLTGDWRVADPDGFAATLLAAPDLAGVPVCNLVSGADEGVGWALAVANVAFRPGLDVRWVSGFDETGVPGPGAGALIVEARAQVPAGPEEPEVFVLAHLVEHLGPGAGGERERLGPVGVADHSWLVMVVGDGAGGVAAIVRAILSCPGPVRCCAAPAGWARLPLAALRETLLGPALEEAGVAVVEGVVLPFSRQGIGP